MAIYPPDKMSSRMDFFGSIKEFKMDLTGGAGTFTLFEMTHEDVRSLVRAVEEPKRGPVSDGMPMSGGVSSVEREAFEDEPKPAPKPIKKAAPKPKQPSAPAQKPKPAPKAPEQQPLEEKPSPDQKKDEPSEKKPKATTPAKKRSTRKGSKKTTPAKKRNAKTADPSEKAEAAPKATPEKVEEPVKEAAPESNPVPEPEPQPEPEPPAAKDPAPEPVKDEPTPAKAEEEVAPPPQDDPVPTVEEDEGDDIFGGPILEENDGFENEDEHSSASDRPDREKVIEALADTGNIRAIVSTLYEMGYRTKDDIVAIAEDVKDDVRVLARIPEVSGRIARACRLVNIE